MKYSNYIELSANYESVVDLDAEERNPNLWQDYIVHEDMKNAVKAVCQTLLWEDNDKRRSFWIHGAYGTGKSYAAIVLKHLFEDSLTNISGFLGKPSLAEYRSRFEKIRKKGQFLVAWKSGATDIKSGTHLMMAMEVAIKNKLKEQYGDKAYNGTSSLISAAKDAVANEIINWNVVFNNPVYGLCDEYENIDEVRTVVMRESIDPKEVEETLKVCNRIKRICDDNNIAVFADTVEKFEAWLQDIIAGNGLKETGIVFIWDEFTGFLRDCGDDNVLQRLSEFCKQKDSPFFMCLIVHRDPTWVDQLGGETYERILHRYHELEFHITPSAAYDLIGDSIIPRAGMTPQWEEKKKELLQTIIKYGHEYDNLDDQTANFSTRMGKLCPLHPMTLSMLATVAQNFGASQRTLFRFMKDREEAGEGVGFIHYIENNNPDEWRWLTADYLWDYFFMRGSDVREVNPEARKVIQHFQNKENELSDAYAIHVFKAALLLIAVHSGSNISNLYSKQNRVVGRIGSIKNTLYKCFRGQLEESTIDQYLESFEQIGLLRLDKQPNGDARLELPYTGNTDVFDVKLKDIKRKYTRYELFKQKGEFAEAVEKGLWDSTRATFRRVYIASCSSETNSYTARIGEIKKELQKCPWKIGILVMSVSDVTEYTTFQSKIKELAATDDTGRLIVAMFRKPCLDDTLDAWHRAITHKEIAAGEGSGNGSTTYEAQAIQTLSVWAAETVESQIFAYYGTVPFTGLYGKSDLMRRVEKDVLFNVFSAAPERLVTTETAYKPCVPNAVYYGLAKKFQEDKKNQQVFNISNALKQIGAWDIDTLDKLALVPTESEGKSTNAEAIAELAKYIKQKFTDGAKISLDTLWADLQQPPFGYYNSMTVGCFLGVVLRSFINGSFIWHDNANNPFLPTEANFASMVNKMLANQTLNNYLSSGSEIWRQFKQYVKKIFGLSDNEVVSDAEARKFAKQKIIGIGVPFWAMKFVPDDKFGGEDARETAVKLNDLLCDFIYEVSPDQENVMADIISLFNGRGQLRKAITDVFGDKATMLAAFKSHIFAQTPELVSLCENLSLTDKDLFDALRAYLQDTISVWREDQVAEKLPELVKEFSVISLLKNELSANEKTYKGIQKVLNNVFDNMKVPGSIIETLSFSWIPAVKIMRRVSKTGWADVADKDAVIVSLKGSAKTAWENLTQPKLLLEAVLNARNVTFEAGELEEICLQLKQQVYETPTNIFNTNLDKLLENIDYNRKVDELKTQWQKLSGAATIREWCNNASMPIAWLFSGNDLIIIRTIKSIQDGSKVEKTALQAALAFLSKDTLSVLSDVNVLTERFFAHIGEGYRAAFAKDRQTLINRLKTNGKISADVYSWENKLPEIRKVLDEYLKGAYLKQAKTRVEVMPDSELRAVGLRLLEAHPELYDYFLN
ncbi:hypothetical protein FACS18949_02070 [Clostridia bacterium]|nr:hypothetical protein FACS18949_02070 [Clostridia bacterium]